MNPRDGEMAGWEMDRLWGGKASGSQTRCRSTFGVYDMTGNVDEWTHSVRSGERPSILKGGYWGPVRTRCRPSTRGHDQNHMFYQQGFRCCSDAGGKRRKEATAALPELPRALE
jgi:formylglycine-generating enzyme required for sulfatase activity